MYDVMIIGAGVSGCAIARALSKYELSIGVLEKGEDVCVGTSKANSGIVHAGYDATPGSLMAKLNVRGNEMMESLCEELDVPFQREGSLVVCVTEAGRERIEALYQQGLANGVCGLQILEREAALAMEPNLSDDCVCALYAPSAGLVCPFGLNIAMAECAVENGVVFHRNTEVKDLKQISDGWKIQTNGQSYEARCVINAAGVYAGYFHNLVSDAKIQITPRRGEYFLLDQEAGGYVGRTIFSLPGPMGKGVLVTPTTHGNLLVGPTAIETTDLEETRTTTEGLRKILDTCSVSVKNLPLKKVITSFSGLRAHEAGHEFLIEEVTDAPGFFDCAGIESPGLSSCPAIGEMMERLICEKLKPAYKKNYNPGRPAVIHPKEMSLKERNELIKSHPEYGNIICRCETISEGEIMDAIHRPLGATTVDGIKRRCRAGMGRCQAGFCLPRTMEILSRELGIPMGQIKKSGPASAYLVGRTKEGLPDGK